MNGRYGDDPYGQQQPQAQQPEMLGYDEYGQPIYRQEPAHGYPGYQPQTPYGQQSGPYGNSPDPYGTSYVQQQEWIPQQQSVQAPYAQDPYAQQPAQDAYAQEQYGGQQYAQQPQEAQPDQRYREQHRQQPEAAQQGRPVPGQRQGDEDYRTEQFSFVEEPTEQSEDVIDWLKFTESRTERREEARRRGRHRITALVVVLVLVAAGGAGYLWYSGDLPGVGQKSGGSSTSPGQQRDVIAVHLRATGSNESSTALLVDNADAKKGNTVLLPNSMAVSPEGAGTTTLAKSVVGEGASPTREALGTLLGADIKGTWRLDTPFLENLVDLVGGISVDTDTTVPGEKKGEAAQVPKGRAQDLDGRAAVAYATYRAPGERQSAQLTRFGKVMQGTLRKMSSDPQGATRTVQSLGQIPDPSLSESQLGASLAKLAGRAKNGAYGTELLPVQANGTLSRGTSDGLVKQVLGGTVKNSDPGSALRVKVTDASGQRGSGSTASAALTNGGYTVVDGGKGGAAGGSSRVTYGEAAQKAKAVEVAKTLDLPGSAVRQGRAEQNADVSVLLGRDYRG